MLGWIRHCRWHVRRRNARVLENSSLQLARGQQLDELKLELQLADTLEEKALGQQEQVESDDR